MDWAGIVQFKLLPQAVLLPRHYLLLRRLLPQPGAQAQRQEAGLLVHREEEVPPFAGVLPQPAADDEELVQQLRLDLHAGGGGEVAATAEQVPRRLQRRFGFLEDSAFQRALGQEPASRE